MPARLRLAVDVLRHLGESVLVPLALFYAIVVTAGLRGALIGALAWAYLALGVRIVRRAKIPALLLMATAVSTIQVVVANAADSAMVFFLQPTVATFGFAAALLATWQLDRPLIQRLANDFCPLPPEVAGSAPLRRLFQRLSLLWGGVLMVNSVTTLALLLTIPTTWSMPLAMAASLPVFLIGLGASYLWFHRSLRDGGFTLSWGSPA